MKGRVAGRLPRGNRAKGRLNPARGVAALAVALVAAACSGGTGPADTPGVTAPPASSGAPGGPAVNAFVDVVDCANAGGSGSAAGTIENQSAEPAAYRIRIGFFDAAGTKLGEGTADTATAAPGATVDWSVTASGLGEAEVTCRTVDVTIVGGAQASASAGPANSGGEYPCTLIPEATVEQLAGNALEPGDADTIPHDENGVLWTAVECAWLSPPGPAVEVDLEAAGADGFPSGTVGCPPLAGSAAPVAGLGSSAAWSWIAAGTELTEGTLRVCSAGSLVDVRVGGPGGESSRTRWARTARVTGGANATAVLSLFLSSGHT